MHGALLGLGLLVMTGNAPASTAPTVAVMPLEGRGGVNQEVADLVSESVVVSVRKSAKFSRVVSTVEIRDLVSFEHQRQMLACSDSSCVAELAGALGVDYIITGNIGRVGDLWLFNLRLVHVNPSTPGNSVSHPIEGNSEGDLVRRVDKVVAELLGTHSKAGEMRTGDAAALNGGASSGRVIPQPVVLALRVGALSGVLAGGVLGLLSLLGIGGGAGLATGIYWTVDNMVGTARMYQALSAAYVGGLGVIILGLMVVGPALILGMASATGGAATLVLP